VLNLADTSIPGSNPGGASIFRCAFDDPATPASRSAPAIGLECSRSQGRGDTAIAQVAEPIALARVAERVDGISRTAASAERCVRRSCPV